MTAEVDAFLDRLRARLERGAQDYGDKSFSKPLAELSDESLQEVEDIAGWSFVMWVRLRRRLERLRAVEREAFPSQKVEPEDGGAFGE